MEISKVIYEEDYERIEEEQSNVFLKYVIALILDKNGPSNVFDISKELYIIYGENNIVIKELIKFLERNFIEVECENGLYKLSDNQKKCLDDTIKFDKSISFFKNHTIDELEKHVSYFIKSDNFDFNVALPYVLSLLIKTEEAENLFNNFFLASYFDAISSYGNYEVKINNAIKSFNKCYNDVSLKYLFNNVFILELLTKHGILYFKDLLSLSIKSILLLFSIDFNYCINLLEFLTIPLELSYKEEKNKLLNSLTKRDLDILNCILKINVQERYTKKDVMSIYEITDKRFEQLKGKLERRIKYKARPKLQIILLALFSSFRTEEHYVSISEIYDFVNDEIQQKYLLYFYSCCNLNIIYDSNLNILYDKNSFTVDEIKRLSNS